ncbi:di-heme enzyme [Myxococcota bacterium]|nr:di-heme enzyme [Myxococcota bacterium]
MRRTVLFGLLLLFSAGCGGEDAPPPEVSYLDAFLPAEYPRPWIPADEPITEVRVELGRRLFYDQRLSGNQTQSCATCHLQDKAFTDGRATALGSTGEVHFRSSMSVVNVAYVSALTWASPLVGSLAEQALMPLFGESPVELGMAGREDELFARLRAVPEYQELFPRAFTDADPFTLHNLTVAIATFERTIISYRSPYDRYVYGGEPTAMSADAKHGMTLFFDERFECFHCHGGFNFSSSTRTASSEVGEVAFHNTGLYDVDGQGSYPAVDTGVMRITLDPADMGKFRAPTLRNVELTAPYFHDGSAATLDDVLDHYARGGRLVADGPNAGDGSMNIHKSGFVRPIDMTPEERAQLLAFLRSLTDPELLVDPRWSDPW